jgi:DNA-binding beta-propeller fold protein YncE
MLKQRALGFALAPAAALPMALGDGHLQLIGRYETGVFDGAAAEIVAHDPLSQRLFVTNATAVRVDVLDISNPAEPKLVGVLDTVPFGAAPTSVDVYGGVVAAAIPASPSTANGRVAFWSVDGVLLKTYEVGALPDMLAFSPDGTRVVVANEGEPAGVTDPAGSISVIDVSAGIGKGTVTTLGFGAFDGRVEELRAKGVRIFPGTVPSQDLEPEYVAISPDGTLAFATLQEANAFAVVDLEAPKVLDIVPLGTKDHARGLPFVTSYPIEGLPVLGTTATVNPADPTETTPGQEILLGGFSGLWFEGLGSGGSYRFATLPDRGPNGEPTDVDGDGSNERPFALPGYQARVLRLQLDPVSGAVAFTEEIRLWREDGVTPITGLPNIPGLDEEPVDLFGNPLPYDALGADLEGLVVAADGSFWACDEYRPAIYHFDAAGLLLARYVPTGTAAAAGAPVGTYGLETLPAEYSKRRLNRGFEALAFDPAANLLYAFIQSPLANPTTSASTASDVIRILAVDPASGVPLAEYVYLLEALDYTADKVDKIGDAVFAGDGRLYVAERDATTGPLARKYLFEADLRTATNLLAPGAPALIPGKTLEQHTADELVGLGVRAVRKRKLVNLPSVGYLAGDKVEGLALLPSGDLAVLNDNDFGLAALPIAGDGTVTLAKDPTPVVLGIVSFPANADLDASDRDEAIAIDPEPLHGLYMPDALTAYEIGGEVYFLSANEGDTRSENERVKDLSLDPQAFPDPAIQLDENLGRLNVSSIDGDFDGDGDHDALFSYGARSFSIWDRYGNLVFDSGDQLEELTAAAYPEEFNSNNDENDSFDARSDDKGPEPEAAIVVRAGPKAFAFVGLERIGGVAVFDVTDPRAPQFVEYQLDRDFSGDPSSGTAGDLGPESLVFIPRQDSPIPAPLLIVANEVSGTTAIYKVVR